MSQEQLGTRNYVQIGLFGGIFGEEYGISFIYFHSRKRDLIIYCYHLRLGVGKKGYGAICQELFAWDFFQS